MLCVSSGFALPNTPLLAPSGDIVITTDLCPLAFGERFKDPFLTLSSTSIGLSVLILTPSNPSALDQSEIWGSWVLPGGEMAGFPVSSGGGVTLPGLHWSGCNPD